MTEDQLKQGKELTELIKVTNAALNSLYKMRESVKKDTTSSVTLSDGLYCLQIGQNSDRSGLNANLNRYMGNVELLDAIIKVIEDQLKEYTGLFEAL